MDRQSRSGCELDLPNRSPSSHDGKRCKFKASPRVPVPTIRITNIMDYHEQPLADRIAIRIQEFLGENFDPEIFDSTSFKNEITNLIHAVLDETYGDY